MEKSVNVAPQQESYDAIVVGSGVTGGWAAKELTERGLQTLVLERGRDVKHGEDYTTEHTAPWEMEYNGQGNEQAMKETQPLQSMAGPVNPYNKHFFVDDTKHPYTYDDDKPFLWVRGYHKGGRSLTWGRQSYRWSPMDFEENARDGAAIDWPIRYDDVAPWYSYVEQHAGISGAEEGLRQLPDSEFFPPMDMNVVEQHVREGLASRFDDRSMTIGRTAILTEAHKNRQACHYCGPCSRGCSVGAYFSSQSSTLPAARATGNMTMQCNSIVTEVLYDRDTGKASGVRVIDAETKEERTYEADLVFLNASALGSVKILLNSTSPEFPNGLANSSGTLGHYIMDHHFKVGAFATFDGFDEKYYYGSRPNGIYIPRFRNLPWQPSTETDFLRGYGYQGGASRQGWGRATDKAGFGADFKHELRDPGPWQMYLTGFGEMLPREDNYVELNEDVTDEWGMPALHANVTTGENERRMREDMKAQAAEILQATGGNDVTEFESRYWPGEGIHEMGGARMGRDPDTSVLNGFNQAHDVPNLFVTDGSCMTSAACQNPSLTYMALTARAVDYAVKEMEKGDI
jgi:choline dehydrogenase-like flavoprotein